MPHVIYLHSALTQRRIVGRDAGRAPAHLPLRARRRRHRDDYRGADQHEHADHGRRRLPLARARRRRRRPQRRLRRARHLPRVGAAVMFGVALLASGLSSSSVGTMAGQVVMQGFIHGGSRSCCGGRSRWCPALLIIAIGVNPSKALDPQPGGALVRDPVRADPARHVLPRPRPDGHARQPPLDDRRRRRRSDDDHLR